MNSLRFYEIDINGNLFDSRNHFTSSHFDIFKNQFQVIDSLSFPLADQPDSIEDQEKPKDDKPAGEKLFDHHKSLIESYKDSDLEFVEPQSMNYDTKIH